MKYYIAEVGRALFLSALFGVPLGATLLLYMEPKFAILLSGAIAGLVIKSSLFNMSWLKEDEAHGHS